MTTAKTDQSRSPPDARYAIQKARGKGWKTLEVSNQLDPAQARFKAMVSANPRAYFRVIQLDHKVDSEFAGMEFDWKLIELYDPTAHGHQPRIRDGNGNSGHESGRDRAGGQAMTGNGPAARDSHRVNRGSGQQGGRHTRRRGEKVAAPVRLYLVVVVIGALLGLFLAMRFNWMPG